MITASTYAMVIAPIIIFVVVIGAVLSSNASTRKFDRSIANARLRVMQGTNGAGLDDAAYATAILRTRAGKILDEARPFPLSDQVAPDSDGLATTRGLRSFTLRGIARFDKTKKTNA